MCMDRQTGLNEIRDSNAVCSWGSHREKECGTEPRSTCQHVNMSKGQSTAVDHRSQLPTSKLATREKREHHNRRVDFVLPCLALKNNQTNMQIRLLSNTLDQRYHKHRNTNTILLLLLLLNDVAWSSSWTWT